MNSLYKLEKEEQNRFKKLENVVSDRAEENKIYSITVKNRKPLSKNLKK
jgi:hypothetical protein